MAQLEFVKVHATGHDFVIYTDAAGINPLSPEQVAKICNRRLGIGADGLIRAVQTSVLPDAQENIAAAPDARWFLDYYRVSGSPAQPCGNSLRAYAHYLLTNKLIELADRRETIAIATISGIKDVLVGVSGYSVDLGRWRLASKETAQLTQGNSGVASIGIQIDSLHQVVQMPDTQALTELDLRSAPQLAAGSAASASLEFVAEQEPLISNGVGQLSARVYKPGLGETPSCGTGAVAAALAARYWGGANMPHNWRVTMPGGVLGVRMFPTEDGEHVSLSGPAVTVYRGVIDI